MKKISCHLLIPAIFLAYLPSVQAQDAKKNVSTPLKNNIQIAPLSLFDIGVGMGINYERFIEKTNKISVVIPVDFLFAPYENNWDGYQSYPERNTYFYTAPGLKFHVSSGDRKVNYSLGPNIFFGYGTGSDWYYNPNTQVQELENFTNTRFGILATNYLDINITPQFNLGFSLGLGIRYSNKYKFNDLSFSGNYYENDVMPVAQFKFTLGYKF